MVSCAAASGVSTEGPGWGARILLCLIDLYRATASPLLGGHCRFWPSCSVYAAEAVRLHGARHGSWLSLRRLVRCHPFHRGGWDPVPPPSPGRPGIAPVRADGSVGRAS